MIDAGLQGVKFVAVNTDVQALWSNRALTKVQIGQKITNGLGAGANPEVGRRAAVDDTESICEALNGSDMGGRTLTVNEARPQEPRSGGGRGGFGGGGGRGPGGKRDRW